MRISDWSSDVCSSDLVYKLEKQIKKIIDIHWFSDRNIEDQDETRDHDQSGNINERKCSTWLIIFQLLVQYFIIKRFSIMYGLMNGVLIISSLKPDINYGRL